jgi:hypothetical protein
VRYSEKGPRRQFGCPSLSSILKGAQGEKENGSGQECRKKDLEREEDERRRREKEGKRRTEREQREAGSRLAGICCRNLPSAVDSGFQT